MRPRAQPAALTLALALILALAVGWIVRRSAAPDGGCDIRGDSLGALHYADVERQAAREGRCLRVCYSSIVRDICPQR